MWLIPVSSSLTSKEINYTGNGLPWCSSQGGFMSFDAYTGEIPDNFPDCVNITPPSGNFCFVPTVSSLDIQGTQNLLKGYTAANDLKNSMFDNIYTEPTYNVVHTNFNTGNTNWIVQELDKNASVIQQSNLYKFNGCKLTGPNTICSEGATYSLSNVPSGVSLYWHTSGNLYSFYGGKDFIALKSSSSGSGYVQAELRGGGTNVFSESKNIWAGELPPPVITGPFTVKCGYELTYKLDNTNTTNGQSFLWDAENIAITQGQTASQCKVMGDGYSGDGTISCTVTACGVSKTAYFTVGLICETEPFLLISPNPTSSETTIELVNGPDKIPVEDIEWSLEVYDQTQNLKSNGIKVKTSKQTINTNGWKDGIYLVRASIGEKIISEKLVVKH